MSTQNCIDNYLQYYFKKGAKPHINHGLQHSWQLAPRKHSCRSDATDRVARDIPHISLYQRMSLQRPVDDPLWGLSELSYPIWGLFAPFSVIIHNAIGRIATFDIIINAGVEHERTCRGRAHATSWSTIVHASCEGAQAAMQKEHACVYRYK
eukprot:6198086-Pleurochrysis_carterae.AAC.2